MDSGKKYNIEEIINIFFTECRELLEDMESSLLELEKDNLNEEAIHAVFRAAHTIKGSAGMFDFNYIGEFTHLVENVLNEIRNGKLSIDEKLLTLLFECHDFILKLIDFFDNNRKADIDNDTKNTYKSLSNKLNSYLADEPEKEIIASDSNFETSDAYGIFDRDSAVENKCWHISLRFGENTFRNGFDPQSFINYLGQMGNIVNIKIIDNSIPDFDQFNPESCYIGFEIDILAETSKEELNEVFEFIKDDCIIRILPPNSRISGYLKLINELPEEDMFIGKILSEIGSLTQKELDEVLNMQTVFAEKNEKKLLGEIVVEEKMVQKSIVDEAIKKQNRIKKSMRVDTDKLDTLINLVGELVINVANVKQISNESGNTNLDESLSSLLMLVENIRDSSMNLRMVQIGETFKRFERVVRDLSVEQGKDIELVLQGVETELDKTLVEKITDPLMHLVRNAVDHGIDFPDNRVSIGKSRKGTIRINAYNETGSFVIEVEDDGNGLNREKILLKAIKLGLLQPGEGENLSDEEVFQFIFMPGFSTAEKITNISGRGVGMDVVRKNINSLRGDIVVQSKEGSGTIIRLYLPLTLAIIDGFIIRTGNEVYVFPLEMIKECINLSKDNIRSEEAGTFYNLRGELIPLLRLRDFFQIEGDKPANENIVIIQYSNKKAGIVVDKTLGEFQTVVKPLGKLFEQLPWLSGATILGSGRVALLLDIPRLIKYVQTAENQSAVS